LSILLSRGFGFIGDIARVLLVGEGHDGHGRVAHPFDNLQRAFASDEQARDGAALVELA
jgi:hypothetical protein